MALVLRNPHSVLAALATRPVDVREVRLRSGKPGPAWTEVAETAAARGIAVVQHRETGGRGRRPKRDHDDGGRSGSGEAHVRERDDVDLGELFTKTGDDSERGLWLALDRLQDPHNVGAVFRSAAVFGVRGIVVTRDQSAPLNATVYDVASGGIEYVPFSSQPNLARALDVAKEAGLWVLGASEHAERELGEIDRDRDWLLVIGNEEKGLRRLTLDKCDDLCRIAGRGPIASLNASVAAGVLIAHFSRSSQAT